MPIVPVIRRGWSRASGWVGPDPILSISNQSRRRLHSQLDHGENSLEGNVAGREPAFIHPSDASGRGSDDEDVVRIFNERGACWPGLWSPKWFVRA